MKLPTDDDLDVMSDADACRWLAQLHEVDPDLIETMTAITLMASPLAGPVRILREVIAERPTLGPPPPVEPEPCAYHADSAGWDTCAEGHYCIVAASKEEK